MAESALHAGTPVRRAGAPLETARAAAIMMHGRGATAESILTLAQALDVDDIAYLAPQAANNTWYPARFLAPRAENEPWLSSALANVAAVLADVGAAGIGPERVVLLGFSQGACLTLDFAARHPRRYGGVASLTGALIGAPGETRDYPGSLAGTPVFIGASDVDAHVPADAIKVSAGILEGLGGVVDLRFYPGMGHEVNDDELAAVRRLLAELV
ncbi:MAG: alpha/beta hydrolase [Gemmatimonadales bacterium]